MMWTMFFLSVPWKTHSDSAGFLSWITVRVCAQSDQQGLGFATPPHALSQEKSYPWLSACAGTVRRRNCTPSSHETHPNLRSTKLAVFFLFRRRTHAHSHAHTHTTHTPHTHAHTTSTSTRASSHLYAPRTWWGCFLNRKPGNRSQLLVRRLAFLEMLMTWFSFSSRPAWDLCLLCFFSSSDWALAVLSSRLIFRRVPVAMCTCSMLFQSTVYSMDEDRGCLNLTSDPSMLAASIFMDTSGGYLIHKLESDKHIHDVLVAMPCCFCSGGRLVEPSLPLSSASLRGTRGRGCPTPLDRSLVWYPAAVWIFRRWKGEAEEKDSEEQVGRERVPGWCREAAQPNFPRTQTPSPGRLGGRTTAPV